MLERPGVRGFWWPRYERIARVVPPDFRARAPRAQACQCADGAARARSRSHAPGGAFTVTAKADRIEVLSGDGAIAILDYKTGAAPSAKQVMTGLSPQLTLEAAIALERRVCRCFAARTVEELVYVALKGSSDCGRRAGAGVPTARARTGRGGGSPWPACKNSSAQFDDAGHRPTSPNLAFYWSDFKATTTTLARVKEWSSGDDE